MAAVALEQSTVGDVLSNMFAHLSDVEVRPYGAELLRVEMPAAHRDAVQRELEANNIGYQVIGYVYNPDAFDIPLDQFEPYHRPEGEQVAYAGYGFNSAGPGLVRVIPGEAFATEPYWLDDLVDDDRFPSHSPDGFQCGYNGSGPAQLACALLWDLTQDRDFALDFYQTFKEDVISQLPTTPILEADWVLTSAVLEPWVAARKAEP